MRKMLALLITLLIANPAFASYVQSPYSTTKGGTGTATQSPNLAVTTDGSGHVVSTSLTTATEIGYVHGVTSSIQTQLGATANQALSNLSSVAINTALLPGASGTINLGSNALLFKDVFITTIKDASSVVSVDPINRVLKDTTGTTSLDYSTAAAVAVSGVKLNGSTSGSITVSPGATPTAHTVTLPATVCGNGQYWTDNGSGVMSCASTPSSNYSVVDGGNAAYSILAANRVVRDTTTLTAGRAYTLPVCNASNIGEPHTVKNLASQTFNITLTAAGSDTIDGTATYVLAPGDAVDVYCGAFAAAGTWDIH